VHTFDRHIEPGRPNDAVQKKPAVVLDRHVVVPVDATVDEPTAAIVALIGPTGCLRPDAKLVLPGSAEPLKAAMSRHKMWSSIRKELPFLSKIYFSIFLRVVIS
jgi:hypothetical protein